MSHPKKLRTSLKPRKTPHWTLHQQLTHRTDQWLCPSMTAHALLSSKAWRTKSRLTSAVWVVSGKKGGENSQMFFWRRFHWGWQWCKNDDGMILKYPFLIFLGGLIRLKNLHSWSSEIKIHIGSCNKESSIFRLAQPMKPTRLVKTYHLVLKWPILATNPRGMTLFTRLLPLHWKKEWSLRGSYDLFIYLFIYLFIHSFICLFIYLFVCLFIYLFVYLLI